MRKKPRLESIIEFAHDSTSTQLRKFKNLLLSNIYTAGIRCRNNSSNHYMYILKRHNCTLARTCIKHTESVQVYLFMNIMYLHTGTFTHTHKYI